MTEFRYFLDLHDLGKIAKIAKFNTREIIMYTTEGGGGAQELGGVLKVFQGKSGDGKNFWRQGGGMLIDF